MNQIGLYLCSDVKYNLPWLLYIHDTYIAKGGVASQNADTFGNLAGGSSVFACVRRTWDGAWLIEASIPKPRK
jgi:hypothetical protein